MAVEAVGRGVWPKAECSDTVRWSVYPDGTLYLLNTEANVAQEVIVQRTATAPRETVHLASGELKTLCSP